MRWAFAAVVTASLAVTGWSLRPLFVADEPVRLEPVGAMKVRHKDFARIDAVLQQRAPGWGAQLRAHVAEAIAEEAEHAEVDPLLVLALIQVESEFQQGAVSVVGARGLMQVRPTTLYFVAQKEGVKLSREEIDADPSLNVRLGVRYLKSMKDQFRGNLDLALMAYNAGPNRLFASLKARNTEPFHNYVRAVRAQYSLLKRAQGEPGDWTLASR